VHREDLVVLLRAEDVLARPGKLGPHGQPEHAVEQEHDERGAQGKDPDALVIGALQPADQAAGFLLARRRGRGRLGRHRPLTAAAAPPLACSHRPNWACGITWR